MLCNPSKKKPLNGARTFVTLTYSFASILALPVMLTAQELSEEGITTSDMVSTPAVPISAEVAPEPTVNGWRAEPLREYQFREYMVVREQGTEEGTTTLELLNTLDDPSVLPNRATYNFWLAGPAGTALDLKFEDIEWYVSTTSNGQEGPFTLEDFGSYDSIPAAFPSIRATEVDNYRGVGLFRIEVTPVSSVNRPNEAGTFDTAYIRRATMKANYRGLAEEPARDFSTRDPYGTRILNELVANPSIIPSAYKPMVEIDNLDKFTAWSERLIAAEERGLLMSAKLPRGGFYRLTPEDLAKSGLSPEAINPDEVRVFAGEKELPVHVTGLQRNAFIGRATMSFYVPEDLQDRKPYIPLWVMLGPEGEKGLRMELQQAQSIPGTPSIIEARQQIRVFKPGVYNHLFPLTGPQLRWASSLIPYRGFEDFEFNIARPIDATEATVKVTLCGNAAATVANATIFINGVELDGPQIEIRGLRPTNFDLTFPTSILREGTNKISIMNTERTQGGGDPLVFVLADLDIPVASSTVPLNRRVTLSNQIEEEPAPINIAFSRNLGFTGQAMLADITNPLSPVLYRMDSASVGGESVLRSSLELQNPRASMIAVVDTLAFRPNDLAPAKAPRFVAKEAPVDYLIVTHPSLLAGANRIAQHRSTQYRVEIVTTDELYNSFSYGELRYESIHRALQHTFQSRPGRKLSKVLLLGEGSEYWWEYRHPSEHVAPNMLPIFGWRDSTVTIRGDDSYTQLVGRGVLPDIDLGRISVLNNEELDKIIDKIIDYEKAPPPGSWRSKHVFVSDDEPEFDQVITEIVDKTLRGAVVPVFLSLKKFPYEDYFRGIWRKRSVEMTETLIRQWGEGAITICYMGHGGPNLWSSERILHIRDVDNINVGGRFPILVAGSCDTGWIDYPIEPVKVSLAEHLLKNPIGGAIAAFIPIDGTSSFEHNFLLTAFYDAFEKRNIRDVGVATTMSKLNYHLYRNNARVTNQYVLHGDPALMAPPKPESMTIASEPAYVLPEHGGNVAVSATLPAATTGAAELYLLGPDRSVVLTERYRIDGSEFSQTLSIPQHLPPGLYAIVLEVTNNDAGKHFVGEQSFPVLPHNIQVSWTTDPPMDRPYPEGTPVAVRVEVSNQSPIPLETATLVVNDAYTQETLTKFTTNLPPGGIFARTFNLTLPRGINTFEGRLYTEDPTETEATLNPIAKSDFKLIARIGTQAFIDVSRGEVNSRRIVEEGTEKLLINVPIYSVFDQEIDKITFRLAIPQGEGWRDIAKITFEEDEVLTPDERRVLTFKTDEPLPPEILPVALELVYNEGEEDSQTLQVNLFELNMKKSGDLEIIPDSFVFENERLVAGRTIFARAEVRNNGPIPLENVNVQLRLNDAWVENSTAPNSTPWAAQRPIARLMPGEEATFRLRWDPVNGATPLELNAYAVALTTTNETNLSNNVLERRIQLEQPPNLSIDFDAIEVSQEIVEAYDVVRVSVPFRNNSDADFVQEFRIGVNALKMVGGKERILMQRFPSLAAGDSGVLQFDWRVMPGQNGIEVNLNEDREYLELTHADNIYTKSFPYVVTRNDLPQSEGGIDLSRTMGLASLQSVTHFPGHRFTLANRQRSIRHRVPFKAEYIVSGSFGQSVWAQDNLMGSFPDGSMLITAGEDVAPIRFRLPADPAFLTSEYEVELSYFGRTPNNPLQGHFNLRVQDEQDWRIENSPGAEPSRLGRFDLANGFFEAEFKSSELLLGTHILHIDMYPMMGRITSPILKSSDIPAGLFALDAETPENSRIVMSVRYGSGDKSGLQWGAWVPAPLDRKIPAAPAGTNFFQWRADLYADNDAVPTLTGIRIVPSETPSITVAGRGK